MGTLYSFRSRAARLVGWSLLVGIGVLLLPGLWRGSIHHELRTIHVAAAASLRDVLEDLGEVRSPAEPRWRGARLVTTFAGSNVLARQIEGSSRVDVFLSADETWVDHLEARGRIVPGSRTAFLANELIVVGHVDGPEPVIAACDLAGLDVRHVVLAHPGAVPAGRYARRWLRSVRCGDRNLWELLAPRLAPAGDVRAALAMVEANPRAIGIVYATDVAFARDVRVLYRIPPVEQPEIRYVAVAVEDGPAPDPALVRGFLDLLGSPAAREVFTRHGFTLPEEAAR